MTNISDLELVQRLILAAALGAALFTLMSIEMADGADPPRIAAQIVTGIGFLGAGAIMHTGSGVQGLTTAATVWVNAAVGVAASGGETHLAVIGTAVTLAALLTLAPVERRIERFARRKGLVAPEDDSTGA
jgi:putative Mg2+ transporter-C (MgtC) family protein